MFKKTMMSRADFFFPEYFFFKFAYAQLKYPWVLLCHMVLYLCADGDLKQSWHRNDSVRNAYSLPLAFLHRGTVSL